MRLYWVYIKQYYMKKKILLSLSALLIIFGFYLYLRPNPSQAFQFQSVCQLPSNKFSDDKTTADVKFPAGGGTTCTAKVPDCPKIALPKNSTVYTIKMQMELKDPASDIGTPYIWVPVSIAAGQVVQIDTRDGFEQIIARYNVGNNPSRIYVIPGSDVWVGNRDGGGVTKLSPLTGNGPDAAAGGTCGNGTCGKDETIYSCKADCTGIKCGDGTGTCSGGAACTNGNNDCREYKVVGNYATGPGPRGVTGDINGTVWVGNYGNGTLVTLNPDTGLVFGGSVSVGGNPYGIIADQYGYVWVSNRGTGTLQAVDISTRGVVKSIPITGPYGIGADKQGNILVASYEGSKVYKINGYGTGSPGTIAAGFPKNLSGCGRGVAADLNGNIWAASHCSRTVDSFTPNGAVYCPTYTSANDTVGVAVDANNNIWVVPYNGNVEKLKPNNVAACTSVTQVKTVPVSGGTLYNYSDMTGLRTVPKSISIAGIKVPYIIGSGAVDVCTDGTDTCTDATPCQAMSAYLSSCTPDAMNKCEIPISIFSMQSGEYVLKNLEIVYGAQEPVTTGGIIPCGREWNDPQTPWNDTAPCDICHIFMLLNLFMNFLVSLASVLAVLAIVFTGFLFITSAGNSEKRNKAKNNLKWIIVGFLVVFLAWLIIDFLLFIWGFLDPLGGEWNVVCD